MATSNTVEIEAERILEVTKSAGLTLRLAGSLAVQRRCPQYGFLASRNRIYQDIDFAARMKDARNIHDILVGIGYTEDREVFVISEGARAIFNNPGSGLHVDIFYDKLDFCHIIPLDGRLETDTPTLPLAELLLGKMQIVKVSEKDLIDTIVLLLEHPLGEADAETVNVGQIVRLCAGNWGLWRTTTMNLDKVRRLCPDYPLLGAEQRTRVVAQVEALLARIDAEPKPFAWRLRALVGDRVKWYKDVEEVK